jgi:NAD(P)-dependent dehydrogenase (short-subunit alcohol dehydrogenase family)
MTGRLAGKVTVVTGGGNGIGRATVLRFLDEGARVIAADVNPTTGAETMALAADRGHRDAVRFVRADVAEEADVAAAIDAAVREFGRLDCMYNNAGLAGVMGPITHLAVADWDYTFAVLVRSVFLGMKHATRVFRQQGGGGAILSTASVAGMCGGDGPQAYSAAKAAVINLTRAVAVELARDRIRVNCICPGGINTPLLHRGSPEVMGEVLDKVQPWPDHGRPEDIAAAAVYLASDDARFVTGEALVVDGGMTAQGAYALQTIGGGAAIHVVGVDHGSTGRDSILTTVD